MCGLSVKGKKQVYKVFFSDVLGEIIDQRVQSLVANSALPWPNPTYAGSALGMIEAFVWITTF